MILFCVIVIVILMSNFVFLTEMEQKEKVNNMVLFDQATYDHYSFCSLWSFEGNSSLTLFYLY